MRSLPRKGATRAGGALAITLLAVTAVSVLSMGFIQLSTAMTNRQAAAVESKRAFDLAEAGLAEAYAGLLAGKSGQVGFDEWPAAFGGGVFWVDAVDAGPNRLRLDSTGISASGRATLSLVLESDIESVGTLGLFSADPVTVPPDVHIDSYDSAIGTYGYHVDKELSRYGAVVGSNGDVDFVSPPEPPPGGKVGVGGEASSTEVLGDVVPGVGGTVTAGTGVTIAGSTSPRETPASLMTVLSPAVAFLPALQHSSAVPFIVPPLELGYESIEVDGDGVLVITGPATVVTNSLSGAGTSEIVFDTTNGPIDLYILDELSFSGDVAFTNTTDDPGSVRVLVAGPDLPDGTAVARFLSGSEFQGMVYVPDGTLEIGAGFELFGALSVKALALASGAKLHVDRALLGAAADLGMPTRVLSWRVVEIPTSLTGGRADPFRVIGVPPSELPRPAEAHDLKDVQLSVVYFDESGVKRTYSGPESTFDWSLCDVTVSLYRFLGDKHWDHDCSLHLDPEIGQNPGPEGGGYTGGTGSLKDPGKVVVGP